MTLLCLDLCFQVFISVLFEFEEFVRHRRRRRPELLPTKVRQKVPPCPDRDANSVGPDLVLPGCLFDLLHPQLVRKEVARSRPPISVQRDAHTGIIHFFRMIFAEFLKLFV